jgi:two-component system nitrate/nitrite response regulator NarL
MPTEAPCAPPVDVLLIDDHALMRRGIAALLQADGRFRVAGEASDLGEALRLLAQPDCRPQLALLDHHLPGVRGIDGIAALREARPAMRIVMLTVSECDEDLVAALRAGADGYLLKTIDAAQLTALLERALAGEPAISPELTHKLVQAVRREGLPAGGAAPGPAAALASLSAREREILALIAEGASNKQIARRLDIAETTVKIHVQHILRKLGLSSRVQAAVVAAAAAAGPPA